MDELIIRRIVGEEIQKIFGQSFSLPLGFERALDKRLNRFLFASKSIDFDNAQSLAGGSTTVSVIGARLGDPVLLGTPSGSSLVGAVYTAWVSANDVVTIAFNNVDDGQINPASGTFNVVVLKKSNV